MSLLHVPVNRNSRVTYQDNEMRMYFSNCHKTEQAGYGEKKKQYMKINQLFSVMQVEIETTFD